MKTKPGSVKNRALFFKHPKQDWAMTYSQLIIFLQTGLQRYTLTGEDQAYLPLSSTTSTRTKLSLGFIV